MSSSKRSSLLPAGPKPPTQLASTLIIADSASLIGTHLITLGANSVVHPRSKLSSQYAPITIGSYCIISERSQIGFQSGEGDARGVVLDDYVVIEVGAVVEASRIGEGTVVEVGAKIGKSAVIGRHCQIGPLCTVAEGEAIPDFTVIYGHGARKFDSSGVQDLKLKMVAKQVEVLRKLIFSSLAKFQ